MIDAYLAGSSDNLNGEIHLLLDDYAIEDRWDAIRKVDVPLKHPRNPVVTADLPWEKTVYAPCVRYDPEAKLFRMWYGLFNVAAWTRGISNLKRRTREYSWRDN